jgi:mono/diheme cytochrome c family protein
MQQAKLRNIALLCLGAMSLASCSYDVQKVPSSDAKLSAELLAKVSYQKVKVEVFDRSCVSCHGNSGNVNLESYDSAVLVLDKIKASAILERRMPKSPNPPLDQDQLNTLAAWIQVGGRKLPADGSNEPPPPPTQMTANFSSIQTHILQQKCIRCHAVDGVDPKAKETPLTTYEEILNSPKEIVLPGNPAESGLILVFQPNALKPMPPLDSGISPLKSEEIKIIEDWILSGAKND